MLASGSDDTSAILWNPTTARQVGDPLLGHLDGVITVAFAPNGETVASASRDKTSIVWNVSTRLGEPLGGHSGIVTSVAFNPANGSLATGSLDRTVILFSAPPASSTPDAIYARLCSVVRRSLTTAEWHEFVPGRPYQRTCSAYQ